MSRHVEKRVKIGHYFYMRDEFKSFHRIIDVNDLREIKAFYEKNIYIGGEFENPSLITELDLKRIASREQDRFNEVFEILEIWDFPKEPLRTLDIGCGLGSFLNQWMQKGHGRGTGVDISHVGSVLAKKLYPNIHISNQDLNDVLNLNDAELVVAFDIIEHLFDPDSFFRLLGRQSCLQYMLIQIPIIHPTIENQELSSYRYFYPTRHLHFYTISGFINQLIMNGFSILNSTFIKNRFKYLLLVEKCKIFQNSLVNH